MEERSKWAVWTDRQDEWWMLKGWPNWDSLGRSTFVPTPADDCSPLENEDERKALRSLLFADASRRTQVARVLSESDAATHTGLCEDLAKARALQATPDAALLRALPAFTRLADGGMEVTRRLWELIGASTQGPHLSVTDAAGDKQLGDALERLRDAAAAWGSHVDAGGHGDDAATALARASLAARSTSDAVTALVKHHESFGGGLRWFRLRRDRIEPLLPQDVGRASDYGFRLWSLCRMASQCGIPNLKHALTAAQTRESDLKNEEEEEAA
ncbi:MAG: hypothetical protein JST54_26645 [Deltaproteobacteria bacterium]|nr:hypothetical protein [Deltaproteobacteria bacterium]